MERTGKQRQILETSLDLFSKKGFVNTTTREIAENAGVNELTIFRNFRNKENLLNEAIEYGFDAEGIHGSLEVETSGDLEEDLVHLLLMLREQMRRRSRTYALMLREMASNDLVKRKMKQIPPRIKAIMMGKLKEIIGDRGRDDIDIETAGVFLASYYIRSEMMNIMLGKDPFHELDERRIREAASIFLHGYLKEELR